MTPDPDEPPVAALRGIGGELLLFSDRLIIQRRGSLFNAANILLHIEREIVTVIMLRELVGVHLIRSFLLVQFLRLTYPGCPQPSGQYHRDAFAENAFLYSLSDNRPLIGMMQSISRATATARMGSPC